MGAGLAGSAALTCGAVRAEPDALKKKALIAITLDLEMSRNFPSWEDTHWDYEKGNLNEGTKQYAVEACRRVKAHLSRFRRLDRELASGHIDEGWLADLERRDNIFPEIDYRVYA